MKRDQRKDVQIIQIVPAQPGWEVVWAYDPELVSDEEYYTQPVACWALVELKNKRFVTAFLASGDDSELLLAYDSIDFLGYAHPGLPPSDLFWKEEANMAREAIKKLRVEEVTSRRARSKER